MNDYTAQHKKAWEYNVYDFWMRTAGTPKERAKEDEENSPRLQKRIM